MLSGIVRAACRAGREGWRSRHPRLPARRVTVGTLCRENLPHSTTCFAATSEPCFSAFYFKIIKERKVEEREEQE